MAGSHQFLSQEWNSKAHWHVGVAKLVLNFIVNGRGKLQAKNGSNFSKSFLECHLLFS
jgi:hypothetical protein